MSWSVFTCPSASADEPLYLEADGILAIEAEWSTDLPSTHWRVESDLAGFSGDGYLRALTDSLGQPGMGTLGYDFLIGETADYQFAFNSRIGRGTSRGEHNDTWVRIVNDRGAGVAPIPNDNDTRGGQWHKVFMNVTGQWAHNASNKDHDAKSLSWNLLEGTEYTLQVSSRSSDHLVDRLILWDRSRYNFANQLDGRNPNNGAFNSLPTSSTVPEPGTVALLVAGITSGATRRRSR